MFKTIKKENFKLNELSLFKTYSWSLFFSLCASEKSYRRLVLVHRAAFVNQCWTTVHLSGLTSSPSYWSLYLQDLPPLSLPISQFLHLSRSSLKSPCQSQSQSRVCSLWYHCPCLFKSLSPSCLICASCREIWLQMNRDAAVCLHLHMFIEKVKRRRAKVPPIRVSLCWRRGDTQKEQMAQALFGNPQNYNFPPEECVDWEARMTWNCGASLGTWEPWGSPWGLGRLDFFSGVPGLLFSKGDLEDCPVSSSWGIFFSHDTNFGRFPFLVGDRFEVGQGRGRGKTCALSSC